MTWQFERVAGPYRGPASGVAWDGEAVLFSLPSEDRILRYSPANGDVTEFRRYTSRTSGLALSATGNLYGAQTGSRRIVSFNGDGSASVLAYRLDGRFHNFPNDLAVDPQGRIWFTDPYGRQPAAGPALQGPLEHASVLRLQRDHRREWRLSRMTFDTKAPTAICVSADGKTVYVSENEEALDGKRELRAYPVGDDGSLGPHAVLLTFGSDQRGPHRGVEGMCLDSRGNIVACAGWQRSGPGPLVYVVSPTGQILETHPAPADLPMSCAFGNADLSTLYLTAGDGSLFRSREA